MARGGNSNTFASVSLGFIRILEDDGTTKVDNLHDTAFIQHHVIKLQVSVSDTHRVQISDTIQHLSPAACDFLCRHFTTHDDIEEIVGSIFHDFVKVGTFLDNVKGFDDVGIMQCRTNTEFGSDFLDILLFIFTRLSFTKLFDRKCLVICATPDKTDRAPGTFADKSPYEYPRDE